MSWRGVGCSDPWGKELPSSLVGTGSGWMGGGSLGWQGGQHPLPPAPSSLPAGLKVALGAALAPTLCVWI